MRTTLAIIAAFGTQACAQPGLVGEEAVQPVQAVPAQRPVPSVKAPVLPEADARVEARRLSEGTFLRAVPGRLVKARTGDVIFVPERSEGAASLPPLVLLAGERLTQIEAAMADEGFDGNAVVGGRVFVYRGREYLLPSTFSQPTPATTPPPDTNVGAERTTSEPAPADADPRVEDLIRDLEAQRSRPRALQPNLKPAAGDEPVRAVEDESAKIMMPEGSQITFRRGRIVRVPDLGGRLAIAFDNDPNSPAMAPLIVQPCAELERVEALNASRGDALAVKVSGRVMSYRSRNYFLPTLIQTTTAGEVVPMQ